MYQKPKPSRSLAADLTKKASKQSYYTIRLFVDRQHIDDAYRAYGYFRWVDDILDAEAGTQLDKSAFVNHQKSLLDACYRGESPADLCAEEWMLIDLVRNNPNINSGLHAYLDNMMAVMVFDANRRERLISQAELSKYTRMLAIAVTEAMYYFIGHDDPTPGPETRYLAVTAAHITHMLRDAFEDVDAGYFNVPREYLQAHGISPRDVTSQEYQKWVCDRVQLARQYFKAGRESLAQTGNLYLRMAGYAYSARFEWILDAIERDNYCLRCGYPERKGVRAGLWMGRSVLAALFASPLDENR